MTLPATSAEDRANTSATANAPKPGRVCLVTSELAGPDYNGGIGTAVRGLALALVRHGYDVDVLYTRVERLKPHCFRGLFQDQVEAYRKEGIRLVCLSHNGEWNAWLAKSHLVMSHLASEQYDHVFFNDMHAEGYYPLLARATAHPGFTTTRMTVVLHSATQWVTELNQQAVTSIESIRLIEMERRCIELADAVISPSAYMLKKYKGYGWKVPHDQRVMPNLLPVESGRRAPVLRTSQVDEIVFFGRLERRKGLWLFCNALDRIKYEIGDIRVTFLGKLTKEDGEITGFPLLRRSATWPFEFRLLGDFDREQALDYLKAGRRVAVMPAIEDNSPCAIMECLYEGIPFIASSGSGGQELVARECWGRNLFEPNVESLTEKLRSIIRHGASTGLPATRPEQNEAAILGWLTQSVAPDRAMPQTREIPVESGSRPALTPSYQIVCLLTSRRDPDREIEGLKHVVELHPAGTRINLLTDTPEETAARVRRVFGHLPIRVADVRRYREFMSSLAQEEMIVAFCHVTEPLPPAWLASAERCFRYAHDIGALTGLSAVLGQAPAILPDYFRPSDGSDEAVEYRIGNSSVLFPLAADTNSGFIALRPELLEKFGDIGPFDEQNGRFKGVQDWIHELALRLVHNGERFEVLVDPVVGRSLNEESTAAFQFGRTARSFVGLHLGHAPGSEEALLARLAIETRLSAQQNATVGQGLKHLASKLGHPLDDPFLYSSDERMYSTLAAMARASGQIELADDLIADHLLSRRDGVREPRPLASAVRRRSKEIRLFDLAAAGRLSMVNLNHEWSFKLIAVDREIEIHPNAYHEGRATVTFGDLDLTDLGSLQGTVRVASSFSRPVRFRVDILSTDGVSRFSLERVVQADGSADLETLLPVEIMTRCNVSLSTEMADPPDDAEGAWARWVDLRLVSPQRPSATRGGATEAA